MLPPEPVINTTGFGSVCFADTALLFPVSCWLLLSECLALIVCPPVWLGSLAVAGYVTIRAEGNIFN